MDSWRDTYLGVVHQWRCDHFGHMNVRYYAHVFDDAGFTLWSLVGVTRALFDAEQMHTVVARTETDLNQELLAGQTIKVRSRFTRIGTKSVAYEQELSDVETGAVHARQTVVEVAFDPQKRSSIPLPQSIRDKLPPL